MSVFFSKLEPFLEDGKYMVEICLVIISLVLNISSQFCNENNIDIPLILLIWVIMICPIVFAIIKSKKGEKILFIAILIIGIVIFALLTFQYFIFWKIS